MFQPCQRDVALAARYNRETLDVTFPPFLLFTRRPFSTRVYFRCSATLNRRLTELCNFSCSLGANRRCSSARFTRPLRSSQPGKHPKICQRISRAPDCVDIAQVCGMQRQAAAATRRPYKPSLASRVNALSDFCCLPCSCGSTSSSFPRRGNGHLRTCTRTRVRVTVLNLGYQRVALSSWKIVVVNPFL